MRNVRQECWTAMRSISTAWPVFRCPLVAGSRGPPRPTARVQDLVSNKTGSIVLFDDAL